MRNKLFQIFEPLAHIRFNRQNHVRILQLMVEKGLIDGNVTIGEKHPMSVNQLIDVMKEENIRFAKSLQDLKDLMDSCGLGNEDK